MTQEEKIKDLEQRLAMVDADNSALCADLDHWKKVAAGLKGHNGQLKRQVEHQKELNAEADELYDNLMMKYQEREKVVEGLQSQLTELQKMNFENRSKIAALEEDNKELLRKLDASNLPWWKRLVTL
jgi:predicted RNase H-like nuclease (RuvC/YqgF family)